MLEREIKVDAAVGVSLLGDLVVPPRPRGLVLFAHGSGSSRQSPRNRFVAGALNGAGLATLLLDLLTVAEEEAERVSRHLRFDMPMLAERLLGVMRWLAHEPSAGRLAVGLFGASTGAAAALIAAARAPDGVSAVVSRGGRPDLAGAELERVRAPTLLIVGGDDDPVVEMNREAGRHLSCVHELVVVPGASHLFEEPGTLEKVAELAADWFTRHLASAEVGYPTEVDGWPPA